MNAGCYRPDIDGLRAIAVLAVLVFHVSPDLLPGGFLGVDVFFVLSGYLISMIVLREQADGRFRFATFYGRRVRRLFPALVVVQLSVLGIGYFALFADEYERLAWHSFHSIAFLLNFRLMDEAGYFDVVSYAKPLLHLWSLSVEEQFYLFWPVLLIAIRRLRIAPGAAIAVLGACSLAFAAFLAERRPDALYFHPLARAWELLVGCALAWWHFSRGVDVLPSMLQSLAARSALSGVGLAALSWGLATLDGSLSHPHPLVLVPLAGVAAIVAAGPTCAVNRFLSSRALVFVGLISYPLYLWHWPLLSYVRIAESGNPPSWLLWAAAILSFVLAWATFRFVERPIRFGFPVRKVVAALTAAMLFLALASRGIAMAGGMPQRTAVQYAANAEAMMKREPPQDEACTRLFPAGQAPVYCRLAQAGERTIAVIGDSHAHVLFPGIAELAARRGRSTLLLANSGCPPFEGAVTGRNERERQACATAIERILGALERQSNIDAVVIASRGPQYIDGTGFGPVEAGYDHPPIAARDGRLSPARAFVEGLGATARRLHAAGSVVAYVLQVPELGVPARDCLVRPLVLVSAGRGCSVDRAVYASRMREYRTLVQALSAQTGFLRVVDPAPVLCSPRSCRGVDDDGLLYADDNHLSVLGSHRVAPVVAQALDRAPGPGVRALWR
ncbi:MAG: acyltransferase [Burkholderiaceae bacterium]|nr:acyltransferase [Burkholderiaceae bacterium]